jgi:hypothetical protein
MSYSTNNIAIATTLKVYGFKIKNIFVTGRLATFEFDDSAKVVAHEITLGNKTVEPIAFHSELRRLSSLARAMANGGE